MNISLILFHFLVIFVILEVQFEGLLFLVFVKAVKTLHGFKSNFFFCMFLSQVC